MTRLATTWLVYHLTHSALLLGIVSFAGQIVSFALGPFAGVWVERLNRRNLLVWTQAAAAAQSLALAALTLAHVITLGEIIALTAFQGLINAFDMPGRQSFLVQMVDDRNDLSNAIAINSSMANGARLIGPAIAGLVIGAARRRLVFPDRRRQLLCRDRILAADAHPAFGYPAPRDQHARANARGLELRLHISTHPQHPSAVCAHQPDGLLLRRAAADLCGPGTARRGDYPRLADGGFGNWCACVGAFPRGPQVGSRAYTHASGRGRGARRRADSVRPVAYVVVVACADGVRRLRPVAGRFRQQHHHPVASARRQTRPRDELLHHGLLRRGAVRQPAGWRSGSPDRSAPHRHDYRRVLCRRLAMVHARTAESQSGHPADLPGDGSAARSGRDVAECSGHAGPVVASGDCPLARERVAVSS